VVLSQLARFRGREVNTWGDGFLAMFDGPQRAIRCAMAIATPCKPRIQVRAGLHTASAKSAADDIGGIAVHIGALSERTGRAERGAGVQHAGDLVIGSGLEFESAATCELKGVPGEWQALLRRVYLVAGFGPLISPAHSHRTHQAFPSNPTLTPPVPKPPWACAHTIAVRRQSSPTDRSRRML